MAEQEQQDAVVMNETKNRDEDLNELFSDIFGSSNSDSAPDVTGQTSDNVGKKLDLLATMNEDSKSPELSTHSRDVSLSDFDEQIKEMGRGLILKSPRLHSPRNPNNTSQQSLDNFFNDLGLNSIDLNQSKASPSTKHHLDDIFGSDDDDMQVEFEAVNNSIARISPDQSANQKGVLKNQTVSNNANNKSLSNSEKDDFLNWLEEEEEDSLVKPVSRRQDSFDSDDDDDGTLQLKPHDSGDITKTEEEAEAAEEEEEPLSICFPSECLPFISNILNDKKTCLSSIPPSIVHIKNSLSQDKRKTETETRTETEAELEQKVTTRLNVLFEIDGCETKSILSALDTNQSGAVTPSQLRAKVWNVALNNFKEKNDDDDDDEEEEHACVTRSFPDDIKTQILEDISSIWQYLCKQYSEKTLDDNIIQVQEISFDILAEYLTSNCIIYDTLFTKIVCISLLLVSTETENDSQSANLAIDTQQLFRKLCIHFSNNSDGTSDFSNTSFLKVTDKTKWTNNHSTSCVDNVVNAAFNGKVSLPLIQHRRFCLLRMLLMYHDPELALHLDETIDNWKFKKSENISPNINIRREEFDMDYLSLTNGLFGHFAAFDKLPLECILLLWDYSIYFSYSSQALSFLLAVSMLLLNREQLLQLTTDSDLIQYLGNLFTNTLSLQNVHIKKILGVALKIGDLTPTCFCKQLDQNELLLHIPQKQTLNYDIEIEVPVEQSPLIEKEKEPMILEQQEQDEAKSQHDESRENVGSTTSTSTFGKMLKSAWSETPDIVSIKETLKKTSTNLGNSMQQASQSVTTRLKNATNQISVDSIEDYLNYTAKNIDTTTHELRQTLIEFNEPKIGMKLSKTKSGLTIIELERDLINDRIGQAQATGLLETGDHVLTLNGYPVIGISAPDFAAIVKSLTMPIYIIFLCIRKKQLIMEDDNNNDDVIPDLRCRLSTFYTKYNNRKIRHIENILKVYKGKEAVLLCELAIKYIDHIEGDPYSLFYSNYCFPVSALEVMSQVVPKLSKSKSNVKQDHIRYLVVDCRPKDQVNDTGHFPTAVTMDYTRLDDEDYIALLNNTFNQLKGKVVITLLGSGGDALLSLHNPSEAAKTRLIDIQNIEACALYFLQRGFPFVCYIKGGFLSCYRVIRNYYCDIDDCLINKTTNFDTIDRMMKFEAFLEYQQRNPQTAALFLANAMRSELSKSDTNTAKKSVAFKKYRRFSLSMLPDIIKKKKHQVQAVRNDRISAVETATATEPVTVTENCKDASNTQSNGNINTNDTQLSPSSIAASTWSNWGSTFSTSVRSKLNSVSVKIPVTSSISLPITAATNIENTAAKPATSGVSGGGIFSIFGGGGGGGGGSSSGNSKEKHSDEKEKNADDFHPDGRRKTLHLSANANADPTETGKSTSSHDDNEKEFERLNAFVPLLKKGDLIEIESLSSNHGGKFNALKEKGSQNLSSSQPLKRILVICGLRLLVLHSHPMKPGFAYVKSNHGLKDVLRLKFANSDMNSIQLFYRKDEELVREQTYRLELGQQFIDCLRYNCKLCSKKK